MTILPELVSSAKASLSRPSAQQRPAALFAAVFGNIVEWAEWLIYATLAPLFASQFFPGGSDAASLLNTFAVFAVGFLMRPLGAALLGAYADRHGRKRALLLSVGLSTGGALVIALCPTYSSIGLAAPVILVLARLVQGFAAGGEFGSAAALLVEAAPAGKRATYGAWHHFSLHAGLLIATITGLVLTWILPEADLRAWGWRIGFGIAAAFGIVTLCLRQVLLDSEVNAFVAGTPGPPGVLVVLFGSYRGAMLRVLGITAAGSCMNYFWMVHFPTYAHLQTGISLNTALMGTVAALIVFLLALPAGGRASDRYGRKPTLLFFSLGSAAWIWPALHLVSDNLFVLICVQTTGMLLLVGYCANCATVMAEQFPGSVRAAGIAIPFACSVCLFGGTVPYVVTLLGAKENVALYLISICLLGSLLYVVMRETAHLYRQPVGSDGEAASR